MFILERLDVAFLNFTSNPPVCLQKKKPCSIVRGVKSGYMLDMSKYLISLSVLGFFLTISSSARALTAQEVGPLTLNEPQEVDLGADGAAPAFRFQAFGKAKLTIHFESSAEDSHPAVLVEGPLSNYGDDIAPGTGPILKRTRITPLTVSLNRAGIYRVLVGAKGTLRTECEGACFRPSIKIGEFLTRVKREHPEVVKSSKCWPRWHRP